nr:ACT domain-containing protein ACR12 [Ipomoea batatas]
MAIANAFFTAAFAPPRSAFPDAGSDAADQQLTLSKLCFPLHRGISRPGTATFPRKKVAVSCTIDGVESSLSQARDSSLVPTPIVQIIQDPESDATAVELSFGDRLGALIDTMKSLNDLGLDVKKGFVTTEGTVKRTKFLITRLLYPCDFWGIWFMEVEGCRLKEVVMLMGLREDAGENYGCEEFGRGWWHLVSVFQQGLSMKKVGGQWPMVFTAAMVMHSNVLRKLLLFRATGRRVEDPDLLERIRLTIINNLIKYHPESSERLAMGEVFGIKAPEKKPDVDVATHIHVKNEGTKRSMLYVETADRSGLLMEIIKIMADINIDVESAEIDTEGLIAKDTFYVSYRGAALNDSLSQVLVNCLRYYLRRPETDEDSY